jgi:hypothetical protein
MALPDTLKSEATRPGGTGTTVPDDPYKATITTAQWIKVEWISADGTCQACWQLKKREAKDERHN